MSEHISKTGFFTKEASQHIGFPWSKSFDFAVQNLRNRFTRSLITMSSLILAVAFLAFILVNLNIATGLIQFGGSKFAPLLTEMGFDVDTSLGTVSTGPKERWIVILSLFVCTVGIINAQLMSVTERFRIIGIFKCLGALDSIILRLFLIEAAIIGIIGAAIGSGAGIVFAFLNGLVNFGVASLILVSLADVFISFLTATAVGFSLSILGVLYPAIIAARMEPVKALNAQH
jgi:ABC-type antimicrobial peptide transport system permease subunit